MALSLSNPSLPLNLALLEEMTRLRTLPGFHVYYDGTAYVERTYTLYLSSVISIGDPTIALAVFTFEKTYTFNFSLRAIGRGEAIAFEYSYDPTTGVTKRSAYTAASDGTRRVITATDFEPKEGTHILRASKEKGRIQLYVDNTKLLKDPQKTIFTLKSVVFETEGFGMYEAHYVDKKGRRSVTFTGNGYEVPQSPPLYPSSYVEFSGTPLQDQRSWIQIRYHLTQKDPTEMAYIRKKAGPAPHKLHVVLMWYEAHISIWSDEGFQAVIPTKFRTPRCLAIYEFRLDGLTQCVPSS